MAQARSMQEYYDNIDKKDPRSAVAIPKVDDQEISRLFSILSLFFCNGGADDDDDDIYNDGVSVCVLCFCLFCLPPAKLTIYI